jgi:hypothetical protein
VDLEEEELAAARLLKGEVQIQEEVEEVHLPLPKHSQ